MPLQQSRLTTSAQPSKAQSVLVWLVETFELSLAHGCKPRNWRACGNYHLLLCDRYKEPDARDSKRRVLTDNNVDKLFR